MSGMFMFPGMFYNHIKDSKLKMPEDFENYDPEKYPHFHVFILTHLGQPIDITALEDNANIIADIPENAIKSVTLNDLMEKGVVFGTGDLVWNGNFKGGWTMKIKFANSFDLFKKLDESDGELQDFHISAYRCNLLYKEQDSLKAELWQRGYKINWSNDDLDIAYEGLKMETIVWTKPGERERFFYNGYTLFYDERIVKTKPYKEIK